MHCSVKTGFPCQFQPPIHLDNSSIQVLTLLLIIIILAFIQFFSSVILFFVGIVFLISFGKFISFVLLIFFLSDDHGLIEVLSLLFIFGD